MWIILIVIVVLYFSSRLIIKEVNLDWQEKYQEALEKNMISSEFLKETNVFDYSNIDRNIITSIEKKATSDIKAIELAAEYVVNNIQYDDDLDTGICVSSSASSTLIDRTGNCASMSMTLTGLLRAMGIAAYSAEGCLTTPYTCSALYSIIPGRKPPIPKNRDLMKRGGFLHQWVEVYVTKVDGTMDILIVDPTSAEILDKSCQDYRFNQISDNAQDICITNDLPFANLCLSESLEKRR